MMRCGGSSCSRALKSSFWRSHLRYRAMEASRALHPLHYPACKLDMSRYGHSPLATCLRMVLNGAETSSLSHSSAFTPASHPQLPRRPCPQKLKIHAQFVPKRCMQVFLLISPAALSGNVSFTSPKKPRDQSLPTLRLTQNGRVMACIPLTQCPRHVPTHTGRLVTKGLMRWHAPFRRRPGNSRASCWLSVLR
jgi:hypothetical protein